MLTENLCIYSGKYIAIQEVKFYNGHWWQ